MALGAANIASALSQTFPTGGSFSRTLVSQSRRRKTQMAGILPCFWSGFLCLCQSGFCCCRKAVLGVIIARRLAVDSLSKWYGRLALSKSEGLVWLFELCYGAYQWCRKRHFAGYAAVFGALFETHQHAALPRLGASVTAIIFAMCCTTKPIPTLKFC